MATFGFIGTGSMGGILARAACKSIPSDQIFLANRTVEKAQQLAEELDCRVADNDAIAESADFIFLGVKPQMMAEMLSDIAPLLSARQSRFVLVSMAAGLTVSRIQELSGGDYPVIRIMPNTPSAVGEGMILYTCSDNVSRTEEKLFLDAMRAAGRLSPLPEKLIDAGASVMGCGVAFAGLFMEALADGAVACGLPRAQAMEFAAQMMAGVGKLALESGQHPAVMKDICCSPGGTTIQGIRALEQGGFRSAVMEAVIRSYEKNADLK